MSNRAFGVEIECYSPDGEDDDFSRSGENVTHELLSSVGFSSWANLTSVDESLYGDGGGYGVEVKSPILVGQEGFEELQKVITLLNNEGYWVEEDCGLHVHLDSPEFINNSRLIIKAVKAWMRNQHLVQNMVAEHRLDNDYCEMWSEEDVEYLQENLLEGRVNYSLRGAINVGALSRHGTIEIRQHEATLNYTEAESWIKFCQSFIDEVSGGTIRKMDSEELLLRRLKVERNASRFLTTKAARNKASRV